MNIFNLNLTCSKCWIIIYVIVTYEFKIISIVVNDFHNTINKLCCFVSFGIDTMLDRKNNKHKIRIIYISGSNS